MADLNDLQAAQTIKIAGASIAGSETNFISEQNGQLKTADICNTTAVQAVLSISTTPVPIRVGGSNLVDRKMVQIQSQGTGFTYGFDSGLQPFNLPNNTTLTFSIGANITLYIKKNSGTANIAVVEMS